MLKVKRSLWALDFYSICCFFVSFIYWVLAEAIKWPPFLPQQQTHLLHYLQMLAWLNTVYQTYCSQCHDLLARISQSYIQDEAPSSSELFQHHIQQHPQTAKNTQEKGWKSWQPNGPIHWDSSNPSFFSVSFFPILWLLLSWSSITNTVFFLFLCYFGGE